MNDVLLIPQTTKSRPKQYLNRSPAYVFHHLIKCGGTSLVAVLQNWFHIIFDHHKGPEDIPDYKLRKYKMSDLTSDYCIVGHFNYDGIYIEQRYPEILSEKNRIRCFTFVREPLGFFISFYYYSKKFGRMDSTLSEFIKANKNLIAYYLNCDEANFKDVIDRYFYVGTVENMQESLDRFAGMIGKRKFRVPFLNRSVKDSQVTMLTDQFIKKFKSDNELDYDIYNYALQKFNSHHAFNLIVAFISYLIPFSI